MKINQIRFNSQRTGNDKPKKAIIKLFDGGIYDAQPASTSNSINTTETMIIKPLNINAGVCWLKWGNGQSMRF